MHVLITGATGFIGSALTAQLLHHSRQVTALTRDPQAARATLDDGVTIIGDLSELTDLNHIDAVINLAGEPIANKRWSIRQKQRIEHSRWATTSALVRLIRRSDCPPDVFISGSAVGYYGPQRDNVVTELTPPSQPDFSQRLCARWEDIALDAQSSATRVCLLRTGIVLQPSGGALAKLLLPFKLGLGGPIGKGDHYMPWIHLQDMVAGILFLLDNSHCEGAYNLTAPTPVTNKTFARTLGKTLWRPALLPTPPLLLKILLGEMSSVLLGGQNAIPEKLQRHGFRFQYPQLQQALSSFDY